MHALVHGVLSAPVEAALLRGVERTTNTELEMGHFTYVCVLHSSKYLPVGFVSYIAQPQSQRSRRGGFTVTLFQWRRTLTLQSAVTFQDIRRSLTSQSPSGLMLVSFATFILFFFFWSKQSFCELSKVLFCCLHSFLFARMYTDFGVAQIGEEICKQSGVSFPPLFYFFTDVTQL